MYVAFDDTDSERSMCTSFLATEVVDALRDLDLIGLPRLVRLNPAVPWKTRGNGALCLQFGRGRGPARLAGVIRDHPIFSYPQMRSPADPDVVLDRCSKLLRSWSRIEEGASPGLVISAKRPSARFYWKGVRDIIEKEDVLQELERLGARDLQLAGGRGIIGATAAMAWRPRDRTFEIITYRERSRWGSEREIDPHSVKQMDEQFPSTFNNYDLTEDRCAIFPHTPCPVLFGIRGDDPRVLPNAMQSILSEPIDRWLMFLSNQGTDDHITANWRALVPDRSYEVLGTVVSAPQDMPGGHVRFGLRADRNGEHMDVMVYEPSKGFRQVARSLAVGDRVRAMGELRREPRGLNLEKLEVISLVTLQRKATNPVCGECGKSMQSLGYQAGYRCKRCGRKEPASSAQWEKVPRELVPRWYEPPVCARRHLSRPLKRSSVVGKGLITL